jgi:DNA-binding CsgD family transcriptional regulator
MTSETIALDMAGELLSSLGSVQFTQRLWQWLHDRVDPQSYHMTGMRFRRSAQKQMVERMDILFFAGEADPEETRTALTLYQRDMEWKQDVHLLQFIQQANDPQLVLSRNDHYPATDYGRMISQSVLGEECSLIGCDTDYVYLLSIFHLREHPSFTLAEINRLRQTCHFLIPLLAQHSRLSSLRMPASFTRLHYYFDHCLHVSGIQLSARERRICHSMLQGLSVPQIADDLAISQCSVRTYMERALSKIGIESKSELFAWCVSIDHQHQEICAVS